jgi:hypothetical protein
VIVGDFINLRECSYTPNHDFVVIGTSGEIAIVQRLNGIDFVRVVRECFCVGELSRIPDYLLSCDINKQT